MDTTEPWAMTVDQLRDIGLTETDVRRLIDQGRLTRVRRGVYRRVQDGEPTQEQLHLVKIAAAWPGLQEGTAFSHISAGVLHELPVPAAALTRITTTRSAGSGVINRTSHRRRAPLPVGHLDVLPCPGQPGMIPVTGLPRTAVDLARTLGFRDSVAVVDAALRRGLTRAELLGVMTPRFPGNAAARAAIEFGRAESESPGESRCRATMKLAGLPDPVLQFSVRTPAGHEVARTDFAWPELGVVGEFDGWIKYGRLLRPGQQLEDVLREEKAREQRIRVAGFWIVRWTERELYAIDDFRAAALEGLRMGQRAS